MVDKRIGDDESREGEDPLLPENKAKSARHTRQTAVAVSNRRAGETAEDAARRLAPHITASGYGKIAEQILELAFESGVRVREDKDLAALLAHLDQNTPIPPEALDAIAEILSYVYRANGQPNPFDAALKDAMENEEQNET